MAKFDAHDHWLKREKKRKEPQVPKPPKVKEARSKGLAPKAPKKKKDKREKKMSNDPMADLFAPLSFSFGPRPAPPPKPRPVVKWDDIVGQAEAKTAMREAIEGATKHAELYKKYGRRPTKGVLLFGPPGNGKTMLGKAAASAMAEMHGQSGQETGFIYLKGPEIQDPWFGGSAKKIRDLFLKAKRHKDQHNYPAVVFIDEAESVLGVRGRSGASDITVPPFLIEMDGLDECSAIVILATNRPNSLDPAVVREGRIDRKVFVDRPTREDALAFFEKGLAGRPLAENPEVVASEAVRTLYDPQHVLYRIELQDGTTKTVTLGHFASGAQVTYLIDAAATLAIEREIATGECGIRGKDFADVIARTLKEQRELDHSEALFAFCESFVHSVVEIQRARTDGKFAKRRSLIAQVPAGVQVHHSEKELPC